MSLLEIVQSIVIIGGLIGGGIGWIFNRRQRAAASEETEASATEKITNAAVGLTASLSKQLQVLEEKANDTTKKLSQAEVRAAQAEARASRAEFMISQAEMQILAMKEQVNIAKDEISRLMGILDSHHIAH